LSDPPPPRIGREIFLAGLGLDLDAIHPWVIDRMVSLLDDQDFRAGDVLFARGDPPEFLYFMDDGEVRLSRPERAPWTYKGRWLVGAYDVFSEQGRTRDAVATKDFHAMRVPAAAWMDLLEDSPVLARSAVTNSARVVASLEERVPTDTARATEVRSLPPPSAPLSLVDRVAAMVDVSMLRGGGVQALVDLAAGSEEVSFARDEVVFPRRVEHERMILVVDGEVLSSRLDPAAQRTFATGDIVCGAAAFGLPALAWESKATSPVRGIAFAVEAWFDLMEEHFDLVRSTLGAMLARREVLLEELAGASGGIVLT
jgi:CRP-like cAMP-binding protein